MIPATRPVLASAVFALLLSAAASAAQVGGITLADHVRIGASGPNLVLNGAGVRTRLVFKVYVAALYLPAKMTNGEEILQEDQPRRLELHMLRDVTSKELTDSMMEALAETLTPAERSPLEARMQEFGALLATLHDVRQGTQIAIDYVPKTGTVVLVDGRKMGRIAGADFNRALLRMWIGAHPRDVELRTALLGNGS